MLLRLNFALAIDPDEKALKNVSGALVYDLIGKQFAQMCARVAWCRLPRECRSSGMTMVGPR